jgi:hypothetical protein
MLARIKAIGRNGSAVPLRIPNEAVSRSDSGLETFDSVGTKRGRIGPSRKTRRPSAVRQPHLRLRNSDHATRPHHIFRSGETMIDRRLVFTDTPACPFT